MKNKLDTMGNRTRNLPAFTAVPPLSITVRRFYAEFFKYFATSLQRFSGVLSRQ